MKYTYLFLLSTTLFILPQFTQAQVAEPAPGGSEVAARSSVHVSIDWAKERLDEMDATLASLESWTALSKALGESRAAFDRANQTASDPFKRATAEAVFFRSAGRERLNIVRTTNGDLQ